MGWRKSLTPVTWKRTLCIAQKLRNSSLWTDNSPTRSERSRSWGLRPAAGAKCGYDVAGGVLSVHVKLVGARVQEHEPRSVHRRSLLPSRSQSSAELSELEARMSRRALVTCAAAWVIASSTR